MNVQVYIRHIYIFMHIGKNTIYYVLYQGNMKLLFVMTHHIYKDCKFFS